MSVSKIKKDPYKYAKQLSEKDLVSLLEKLSKSYHDGNPLVDDDVYDKAISVLKEKNKNNSFLTQVGSKISNDKKMVELPFYTGSLQKKKPESKEIDKWLDEYDGSCIVSDKLDGASAVFQKEDNELYLYSRGDGIVGQDISHLIKYLFDSKMLSKLPSEDFTVRGELIMSIKNFDTYFSKKYENARNMIAGLINSKTLTVDRKAVCKNTQFMAHQVFEPQKMKPYDQMIWLEKNGFSNNIVYYKKYSELTEKNLAKLLEVRKKESPFKIDGLVVTHNKIHSLVPGKHPKYSWAYKPSLMGETAETEVVDVKWHASKFKYLKPTLEVKPVKLEGTTVTYATAFNAKYVVDNKIGKGAIVKLAKGGDVIPDIIAIIKPAEKIKYPKGTYEWNETKVDFITTDSSYDNEIKVKNIVSFFKILEVKYISTGIVQKLVDNGFSTIKKIISADIDDVAEIEGLGDKSAKKIYTEIKKGLKNVTLSQLMSASNTFGRGFAEKRFVSILENYPDIIDNDYDHKKLVNVISDISGFNKKTAEQFADGLPDFIEFLDRMKDCMDVKDIKKRVPKKVDSESESSSSDSSSSDSSDDEDDKKKKVKIGSIVFTGVRDKDLEKLIQGKGGKVTTSVSKNTSLVVAKNPFEKSSKLVKARLLKIKIVSYDEFKKTFS